VIIACGRKIQMERSKLWNIICSSHIQKQKHALNVELKIDGSLVLGISRGLNIMDEKVEYAALGIYLKACFNTLGTQRSGNTAGTNLTPLIWLLEAVIK